MGGRTVATLKQSRGLVMDVPGQKPPQRRLMRASGTVVVERPVADPRFPHLRGSIPCGGYKNTAHDAPCSPGTALRRHTL